MEQGITISPEILAMLSQLTKESNAEDGIKKLILHLIETKISYFKLVDKQFQEKKGLSFDEYEDTKREEWDGSDWSKIQEYYDWEDAVTGISFYEDFIDKWKLKSLKTK